MRVGKGEVELAGDGDLGGGGGKFVGDWEDWVGWGLGLWSRFGRKRPSPPRIQATTFQFSV